MVAVSAPCHSGATFGQHLRRFMALAMTQHILMCGGGEGGGGSSVVYSDPTEEYVWETLQRVDAINQVFEVERVTISPASAPQVVGNEHLSIRRLKFAIYSRLS